MHILPMQISSSVFALLGASQGAFAIILPAEYIDLDRDSD